jgi:hypothetical protein
MLASLVDKAAFVDAINDAWALVALVALGAVLVLPLARRTPRPAAVVLH